MNAHRLTVGERLTRERIAAEKRTFRILLFWLGLSLIVLAWQYGT